MRAGKVRCGNCQTVFNAIDALLDDSALSSLPIAPAPPRPLPVLPVLPPAATVVAPRPDELPATAFAAPPADESLPVPAPEGAAERMPDASAAGPAASDQAAATRLPHQSRETPQQPEQSRWLEGVLSQPALAADRRPTRPFAIAAALLAVALAGQLAFHFRSAIAITLPALRPALEAFSDAVGSGMPLPRRAELLSIEASDLQIDPAHDQLLALQATLRNRATHAQAYPALELTLTDSTDKAVARRVLLPDQYLPPAALAEGVFAANADVEVRLWFEARDYIR